MLIRITSPDNSRVKLVRKLSTRKGRTEEKRFTAEGRNLVSEILSRGMDVDFIMIPEGMMTDSDHEQDGIIKACAESPDITLCEVPSRVFSGLTDAGTGIGMIAVVRMPGYGTELIDGLSAEDNVLVLDRIQDPGNMGTLIRTAAAAGYKAVIAISGTVDVYSPKVLRATAGMIFEMPVIYIAGPDELRDILRRNRKRAVVTAVDRGIPYYDADLSKGVALIIGNEGRGVSDAIMDMADIRVTIPMKGNVESLNAAVAAAVLMYESMRQQ
jgi:TrmH family RNA methyltransferase